MSELVFQVEFLEDCLKEILPMLEKHYYEVSRYTDKVPFNPDIDWYLKANLDGSIRLVTVRDGEKLVGYCITLVYNHQHSKEELFGINDNIYLSSEYRKTGVAKDLMVFVEKDLVSVGVTSVCIGLKVSEPFKTLEKELGYVLEEYLYSKYIGN